MAKTGPKDNWKQTPEALAKLKYALAIDATVADACVYAGISERAYYRWMEEDGKLKQDLERLRLNPTLTAQNTVVQALKRPDHAWKWLEKKRPKEFGPKQTLDLTSSDGTLAAILGAAAEETKPVEPA